MQAPRKRRFLLWALALCLAAGAVTAYPLWLHALGEALIHSDGPERAEIAVVLAGDGFGNRITKAAELVREGYVPRVLVSGPQGSYGVPESDLAIAFAVRKGYPAEWFAGFPNEARSTDEEARAIIPELRRLRIKHYLLVTSNFHTARSRRVFRAEGPDLRFQVVASPDRDFDPEAWWRSRQGWKTFVLEWQKTVATWLGI